LFQKLALSTQETESSDAHTLFKMAGEKEMLTILFSAIPVLPQ